MCTMATGPWFRSRNNERDKVMATLWNHKQASESLHLPDGVAVFL